MDEMERYFVSNANKMDSYIDVLNWYRNLYYHESTNTERGIMAWAINDLFISLQDRDNKQIPMAVKREGYDESDFVYCPRCLEYIGSNELVYDMFYGRENHVYCEYCGQKLKER
jgi:hypothetical protein